MFCFKVGDMLTFGLIVTVMGFNAMALAGEIATMVLLGSVEPGWHVIKTGPTTV